MQYIQKNTGLIHIVSVLALVLIVIYLLSQRFNDKTNPAPVDPVPVVEEVVPIDVNTQWLIEYFSTDLWAKERADADGFGNSTHYADQLVGAANLCIESEAEVAYAVDQAVIRYFIDETTEGPVYITTLSLLYEKADEYGEGVSCLGLLPEVMEEVKSDGQG